MSIQPISEGFNPYQKLPSTELPSEKLQGKPIDSTSNNIIQSQADIKISQQASIVEHLFGDPNKTIESSSKITFQAAIDKLNEHLQESLGEFAISEENLKSQGGMEYWTPENTAARIVTSSTAFLAGFQQANPELAGEELMDRFIEVVGSGLQKGFDEAQGILGDAEVFSGKIEENFAKTVDLVQKGLEEFKNHYLDNASKTDDPIVDSPKTS